MLPLLAAVPTLIVAFAAMTLQAVAQPGNFGPSDSARQSNDGAGQEIVLVRRPWGLWCRSIAAGEMCAINVGLVREGADDQNTWLGIEVRRLEGNRDDVDIVHIETPLRVDLKSGLSIRNDRGVSVDFVYSFCDQTGCHVFENVERDSVADLMDGEKLDFSLFVNNQSLTLPVPLDGVDQAFDELEKRLAP